MKGFRVSRHGGPEALEWGEWPDPVAGPGEVLIRVRACALNRLDLWVRDGVPGHRFPLPLVPGAEMAGDVLALGPGVTGPAPGTPVLVGAGVSCGVCAQCCAGRDPLCARFGLLGEDRDGGYAELAAVPARNLFAIPAGLSHIEAAAIPLVFLTAWHMLASRARLEMHEDVLVHAAGSGVSSAAIQIAALLGARRILATASTEEKGAKARALGATDLIDSRAPELARAVRAATGGRGVDVIVDHVGGEAFEQSLRCLARGGRIVLCGSTAAPEAKINLRALFFKLQSVLGSTMGSNAELAALLPWFERGRLKPVVAKVLPLAAAREAQELLASRTQFGKIVLEVTG
jgi:NADPH:quinone reductase-like Zn-dependent oxidoreductase